MSCIRRGYLEVHGWAQVGGVFEVPLRVPWGSLGFGV